MVCTRPANCGVARSFWSGAIIGLVCGFFLVLMAITMSGCEAAQKVDEVAETARVVVNDPALGVSDEVREPVNSAADVIDVDEVGEVVLNPAAARDTALSIGASEGVATGIGLIVGILGGIAAQRRREGK